jgi:hypothetical protein
MRVREEGAARATTHPPAADAAQQQARLRYHGLQRR